MKGKFEAFLTMTTQSVKVSIGIYKAIETKHLPCTGSRGARIKASDHDGNSVTIPYPHELRADAGHAEAARKLCEKMNWQGKLLGAQLGKNWVFIFVN